VVQEFVAPDEPTCDTNRIATYQRPPPAPFPLAEPHKEPTTFPAPPIPFPLAGPHNEPTALSITHEDTSIEDNDPLSQLVEDGLLCPFCDYKLQGDEFSPSLKKIWTKHRLSTRTWPSPVLWNPKHRDSKSFTVYLDFCQQHRLEEQLLPLACQKGWPTSPNFEEIPKRIQEIAPEIRKLIGSIRADPRTITAPASQFYDAAVQRRVSRGPDLSVLRTRSAG
jgi:hypothetical protein